MAHHCCCSIILFYYYTAGLVFVGTTGVSHFPHRKHLSPVIVGKVGVLFFQEVVVEHHRPLHLCLSFVEQFRGIGKNGDNCAAGNVS